MEKVSVFIKIRGFFWPEISALGVFFNFDNERMRPPKYPSAPPGSHIFCTHSSQEDVDVPTASFSTTPPADTPTEEQEQGDSDILDVVGDEDYQGKWTRWNRSGYIFTDAQELDIAEWFIADAQEVIISSEVFLI